jgi:hypothetical protein
MYKEGLDIHFRPKVFGSNASGIFRAKIILSLKVVFDKSEESHPLKGCTVGASLRLVDLQRPLQLSVNSLCVLAKGTWMVGRCWNGSIAVMCDSVH